ncbi:MAG: ATP synthase epsilon chain [Candidatus Uhrbacteria bacterium GW2011_GWF2_41_16]|jgi:F-type H+-transporting ATPase subunit epsilon|uniref:ATP synthase epsilon chain n=2 Tax=Candidatus Uhriibacteriota TaxID=1752732 RepID=A0A0G0V9I9_9BACT|nr:MAG: ATP synthase epsilon chain [Candidatus Uhrbacteria bacterium GW2011_GWA2_41_10]KKR86814.1 MAG: ATP synthase epsilon chain [Candidatus Uhrbacteria bacterium GW2011_GWC2_41_11]KKR97683.1 MAG: ATP synthase epsilon chain [Candidatus Uhrbacteria bacterium GW2011_GWF2_41_16]HBO99703.1 ATP synthase F1 subunit epsilon [Candidatus Uhrbacteria bacterium]
MKLSLKVVTPERVVFEDEADALTLMTELGEITVLPGHIPLVATLRPGEMRLKKKDREEILAVSTGFLEVRPGNQIIILADTAEYMEELELEKIEEAKERAKQLLKQQRFADDVAFADASAALERELARHRVVLKKKYRATPHHIPGGTAQENES